ncbi:MAG: terminase large subunit [Rhodobacteraceae bacterium]|nr:terminase large subunit [Paracoccaceae bacterium]MBR9823726.1 terminase large subunit [Paracoccaceae bacterium]
MPFDFSCPDWEDRLRGGVVPMPDLPLNEDRAKRAVKLFNGLRLPDVPGKPHLADAAGTWFRQIVATALAAEDPESGMPLVNELFCLVPKKNSKTTYSAALGLTALMLWDRPNAEMLILGPTQNVAERCFNQAAGMIDADDRLKKIFHVQHHLKRITRHKTGATLTVKTFDLNVVTGEIPALTIIDELHVVAGRSYADRVVAQITGGMVTNSSALLVYITTQSDTRPKGVFKTKLDYARRVRDGDVEAAQGFLPVLYEFPESMQVDEAQPWREPDNWPMVTPNMGLSVNLTILKRNFAKAEEEGPEAVIIWASQHLNIQIGMGLHDDRWSGADYWMAATDTAITLDEILAVSDVCTIGIDPGGLDDLLSLSVIGRHAETKRWLHWQKSWCDKVVLTRRKKIAAELRDFERAGDLGIVHGIEEEAMPELVEICERVRDAELLPEEGGIGVDAAGGASGAVIDALEGAEFELGKLVVPISQGYRLNAIVQHCAMKLKAKSMRHSGQAIMAWAVGNAKTEASKNSVIVTKAASGSAKIDPLMSLFDAAELMSRHPVAANGGAVSIPDNYRVA